MVYHESIKERNPERRMESSERSKGSPERRMESSERSKGSPEQSLENPEQIMESPGKRKRTGAARPVLKQIIRLRHGFSSNGGFGMNELLGIAAALLLAAFIIIPGLQTFTGTVMTRMTSWWEGSIITKVFPTS
ncbi:MAG: hypothetical protein HGA22_13840 [Clostridiales bacterium]|nr:hypothetical protein [Clostridiales bacterium]